MADSEGVAFLRSDVERFCREIAGLAPAVRLRRLAELRVMLEDVTSSAMSAAMADARDEGWGLRRIGVPVVSGKLWSHIRLTCGETRRVLGQRRAHPTE